MTLKLQIVDANGAIRQGSEAEDEVFLVHRDEYRSGDRLVFSAAETGFFRLALDAALAPALVYYVGGDFVFPVPFEAQRKTYPPLAFSGTLHRLQARRARPEETAVRRDLAHNPLDHHGNAALFPHASANVETRGEAVFAARNAIDGECANDDHGFWPYTSWGINQNPLAELTLDFGREVEIDALALTLRADFPHDAWWERASVSFSDGSEGSFPLRKTGAAQHFAITPRVISSLRLHSLLKADDPSPFPALTRIEVRGRDTAA